MMSCFVDNGIGIFNDNEENNGANDAYCIGMPHKQLDIPVKVAFCGMRRP